MGWRTGLELSKDSFEEEWRAEAGARRAEVEGALAHMWAVASGEERVGAELAFTFWVERGALSRKRGGAAGLRWFRTQLVRAGSKDKELLRRLFAKVETEGVQSLSAAERNELTQALRRMEQLLTLLLPPAPRPGHACTSSLLLAPLRTPSNALLPYCWQQSPRGPMGRTSRSRCKPRAHPCEDTGHCGRGGLATNRGAGGL